MTFTEYSAWFTLLRWYFAAHFPCRNKIKHNLTLYPPLSPYSLLFRVPVLLKFFKSPHCMPLRFIPMICTYFTCSNLANFFDNL